jgi:hypothetical protein
LRSFDSLQTESITEHLVHKKQREDAHRAKEAEKAWHEKKREEIMRRQDNPQASRGGRAGRADARGGRFGGRGAAAASSKYKVLETASNDADKKEEG